MRVHRYEVWEAGNKEIDVELNGTKLQDVLWADDETGECEVFETDWRTGERVEAADNESGYRTMRVKGKVKINDRRPKTTSHDMDYESQYAMGCLPL